MRDAIRSNAHALGESASTYLNNIIAKSIVPKALWHKQNNKHKKTI